MENQHKYWLGRWERRETGWHQDEFENELIEGFKGLAPTRVFVPLCGKSLDLIWLASQNHEVIGVELSEGACKEFFEENKLSPKIVTSENFEIYSAKNITIYCGDFFKLNSNHLGAIGAVYDRGALIALSPDLRPLYVRHLTSLLMDCSKGSNLHFLQICWERAPHDLEGPPFSVTQEDLASYYSESFHMRLIKKEAVDMGSAANESFQIIYMLSWRV